MGCFWKMNGNGWNGEVKCGGSELGYKGFVGKDRVFILTGYVIHADINCMVFLIALAPEDVGFCIYACNIVRNACLSLSSMTSSASKKKGDIS